MAGLERAVCDDEDSLVPHLRRHRTEHHLAEALRLVPVFVVGLLNSEAPLARIASDVQPCRQSIVHPLHRLLDLSPRQ